MYFWNMVTRVAITGVAIVTLASPLPAQTGGFDGFIEDPLGHSFDVFPDSPEWKYFRTPGYCYASAENERGVLLLGYDRRRNQAHLAFWNKNIAVYKSADTTNFEIVLFNIIPGVGLSEPDRTWGLNRFVVGVNSTGKRVFNTKLNGLQMLSSFSRFDRLAFFDEATVIQNFDLPHSSRAMNRLRACVPR